MLAKIAACLVTALLLMPVSHAKSEILTFDSQPILSDTQQAGAWYKDRTNPSIFEMVSFQGDSRLHIGISGADRNPTQSFYNTQGRKYDFNSPVQGYMITGDLYVPSTWNTGTYSVGMWGTLTDGSNQVSGYPIMAYRRNDTDAAGFYGWDYISGGYHQLSLPGTIQFDQWYTLGMQFDSTGIKYFINGVNVGQFADTEAHAKISNIILNSYNNGINYDVYWDNVGVSAVPIPGAVWLLGSGLAGLVGLRRKFFNA